MSDKYKEMAESFLKCCKTFFYPGPLVSDVALIADAMRFCAAKLEAERRKDKCEWEVSVRGPGSTKNERGTGCGCLAFYRSGFNYCPYCGRLIVEKESVIAPTSAGGTTKSIAVTPDEEAPK